MKYRIYADFTNGYEYITTKIQKEGVFTVLDKLLYRKGRTKVLVIQNEGKGDVPYFVGFSTNLNKYEEFKEKEMHVPERQKMLIKKGYDKAPKLSRKIN